MATYKTIKYIVPTEVVEHTDSINALADVDTSTAAPTEGQTIKWDGTNWVPGDIEEAAASSTQKAIFGFGDTGSNSRTNITNLVSSSGVVATDTTGVGTARTKLAAAGYGGDKAIFGFGETSNTAIDHTNVTNLVSNTGVVSTDSTGVGSVKSRLAAAGFGGDKAIFGYGDNAISAEYYLNETNLVSNAGVVASDTTGVGQIRSNLAAAGYGGDKALFGFGSDYADYDERYHNVTNLVSNTGVVASDTTGVGSARFGLSAASYGGDKAIFIYGFGNNVGSKTNLVSNTGVVATDTTGVGTLRSEIAASGYGGDKAIFGFGIASGTRFNTTNLISNTGVMGSDQTGVGTVRSDSAAAGYSTTA